MRGQHFNLHCLKTKYDLKLLLFFLLFWCQADQLRNEFLFNDTIFCLLIILFFLITYDQARHIKRRR
jgi:hypothetical protein